MAHLMTRRILLTTACSVAVAAMANADPSQPRRIGLVTSGQGDRIIGWFREAFKAKGYHEGKDLIIELREAKGHYALLPNLVDELVALRPDVIIAEATPAIAATQRATSTIPIIMSPSTDPIGSGFVKSFAKPGGNITGVANMFGDLTAKTLDIVRLLFPKVQKIGVLTSDNPTHPALAEIAATTAGAIGIAAQLFVAPNPEDLDKAFADMQAAGCEVVYVLADPPRQALPSIALKYRLPTAYQVTNYPDLGGLMAYGPDIKALFLLAADYADRILKGANPADLPVEQPTKFQFVINLQTAKALHLAVQEQVLLLADRVIE
ncbi:ABC transporter substrate-binding protein [Bradyrhizobium diazoefficiens]|uniref:ABC transporter substrate-binding protein n=1 Tax=Bradyrhizobium diazoefficiens TaxID=1355477 RepID=UPI00190BC60B|nr:ABC transporter substrate-binding protein [Bradyrhizobium diazoefficiens]MBK3659999.1 ABC transporter substrate-binding protein [Bradyrhizobium diazoefficiens]